MFFQYYSIVILIVCAITMVVVSFVTKAPDYKTIAGLTFGTTTAEHREESRGSWGAIDVVASAMVLVAIIAAYLYFTG
jgi:SSS family solute:Na+ symporter